jgi:hypothetical protein
LIVYQKNRHYEAFRKEEPMNRHTTLSPKSAAEHEVAVEQISQALNGLRFGSISVVVHDGRVTQIDVTEKRRLTV